MANHDTLMKRIAWTAATIWLTIDATVAVEATRQSEHRIVEIPEQTGGESNTVSTERMTEHILEIARNVAGQSQNQMVDMAFIVDGSRGMMGRISTLEDTLFYVEEVFDEELIDSRFWFQRLDAGANISVSPFASDIFSSRAWFQKLRLTPGDSARCYGLDAILQTLREVNFRPEASKHLLVVSHSSLRTVWDVRGAEDKMVKQIIRECNNDQIYIHVIGLSEPEPLRLAIGTGGKLYPISNSHNNAVKFLKPADLDRSILKTEGIFGLTAKHIAETATQSTDIIFCSIQVLVWRQKQRKCAVELMRW
ncbi:MAG: hypothetical protein OXI86_11150 [Candidatus Poribacteria bacterium]|nr:hypothetical protein [Candidatus Poribacteria bacterium]